MFLKDRITLNDKRMAKDGSLIAYVNCARAGCQDYAGYEIGKPDLSKVTVYRPAEEVSATDSMASFAHAPVTFGHPPVSVTAENWKQFAVGDVGQEVAFDNNTKTVKVPLIIRDGASVSKVNGGINQISMGYDCTLDWADGVAPDGTPYQATQRNIRINHLAIVDSARGGPALKIGDTEMTTKTITFDGLPLVITDAGEAAVAKRDAEIKTLASKLADAETKVATVTTDASTKDAEIATLKQQLADAKVTPEQMRDAAKAYALVVDQAKKLGVAVTDAMSEADIRKAAVTTKLGDAAKGWTADQVAASFGTLAASISDADPMRVAIAGGVQTVGDAKAEYAKAMQDRRNHLSSAYRASAVGEAA